MNSDISGAVSPNLPDVVVPKLIRTADVRFQVEDLEKSSEIIDQLVKQHGSYVSTANMSSTNTEANNTISVRVPNEQFDALLKDVLQAINIHATQKCKCTRCYRRIFGH